MKHPSVGKGIPIYGVGKYTDTVYMRLGDRAKNGKSYTFSGGHPGYGHSSRVPATEAQLTRDAAVAAWRIRLISEANRLEGELACIRDRLKAGPEDEAKP